MNFQQHIASGKSVQNGTTDRIVLLYDSLSYLALESLRCLSNAELAEYFEDGNMPVHVKYDAQSPDLIRAVLDKASWLRNRSIVLFPNAVAVDTSPPPGYEKVRIPDVVRKYLGDSPIQILVNTERMISAIILAYTNRNDAQMYERFAQVAWLAFPYLYPTQKDAEKTAELLKDVATARFQKRFDELCAEFDKRVDLDMLVLMQTARSILDGDRAGRMAELTRQIKDAYVSVKERENSIARLLGQIDLANAQLKTLAELAEVDPTDFLTMLKKRNAIKQIWKTGDAELAYWVEAPLTGYNTDEAERHITNYWRGEGDIRKALKAILIDEKYTIQMYARFTLGRFNLQAISCDPIVAMTHNLFPNPHLCGYGCLGGNRETINEFARCGNYESAVDVSLAASRMINFNEAAAQSRFRDYLLQVRGSDTRCFVDNETGELFTLNEVIQREKQKETEEQENGETVNAQ